MTRIVSLKATLAGLRSLDVDVSNALRVEGISAAMLTDPFASIDDKVFNRVWMEAADTIPDPTLPTRTGLVVPPHEFDLVDYIADNAESVGHAIRLLKHYRYLISETSAVSTTGGHGEWLWIVENIPPPFRFIAEQLTLASAYARFRRSKGFSIQEVHLSQPDNGDADRFARVWGAPVKLGRRYSGIRLSKGVWSLQNPDANPHLLSTLTRLADRLELRILDRSSFVSTLRDRLSETLGSGRCSMQEIARDFNLSPRSLQRRLSDEGLTFKELLDKHRRERAFRMLYEGERNISIIAYSLGYNGQGSFSRAFRRWTGTTPTEWAHRVAERVEAS